MDYLEDLKDLAELTRLVREVRKLKRKPRSCATQKVNRDRDSTGYYQVKFLKMKDNPDEFFENCRMNKDRFEFLLSLIVDKLEKYSVRKPISAECRLAVTLTYLSKGVSVSFLARTFKLGKETVRKIILETCQAIWGTLHLFYVGEPTCKEYLQIRQDYRHRWNLPHCVGSIDGKHIAINRPRNDEAMYYNYKKFYSIVLLAACDARYKFTFVDVGGHGGNSEDGLFLNSEFGKKNINKQLNLPAAVELPGSDIQAPSYFVGNSAIPLAQHIMKQFADTNVTLKQEIYNKNIGRGRETVENTFGILAARWRILINTIQMVPENAEKVVLACIALHNFVMMDNYLRNEYYCPPHYADWVSEDGIEHLGKWRDEIQALPSLKGTSIRYNGLCGVQLRNKLCDYFC